MASKHYVEPRKGWEHKKPSKEHVGNNLENMVKCVKLQTKSSE